MGAGERERWGRLRYLLTLSRPRFWFYLAGPVLVGVAYGASTPAALLTPLSVALFAYFLVPANVLLYGVNDAFDVDADAENPKKTDREARYRSGPAVVAAIAASAGLGLGVLAVAPPGARPWLVGWAALSVAYSAPPLRLKTRPPLDSVSNGLYVLPGAAAYVAVSGTQPPALAVLGGWLWTMAMHTFSAIPDVGPDRRAGVETTATALGARGAYAYCGVVWAGAAAVFGLLDVRAGLLLAVYPVVTAAVARSGVAVERAYWWFPALNTAVGATLTVAGLWGLLRG